MTSDLWLHEDTGDMLLFWYESRMPAKRLMFVLFTADSVEPRMVSAETLAAAYIPLQSDGRVLPKWAKVFRTDMEAMQ